MGAIGDSGKDALGIANGSNMIFDHVSVSWGRDETFSVSGDITADTELIEFVCLENQKFGARPK